MSQVGRYEIVRELGRGGMGIVYLANDTLLKRQVAIKRVLPPTTPDQSDWDDTLRRFIREAQAAASLNHPNLVAIYDVTTDEDATSIVMEFVQGKTLDHVFPLKLTAPPAVTLGVLRQSASALDYAHSRGIVHRDIKPANILLDLGMSVKIADFGLAKPLDSDTVTRGAAIGTLEYMSPEQLDAQPVDKATDQYSLGVVAYRMLTGCRIFQAESMPAWFAMVFNKTPVPASQKNPMLPPATDDVLNRAMAKTPGARYASCSQFVAELERALNTRPEIEPDHHPLPEETLPLSGPVTASGKVRVWSPIQSMVAGARKSVAVAAGALLLAAVGWFAVEALRRAPHAVPVRIAAPDGVSVRAGGNQCVTPNCTLSLQPGRYTLLAGKDGYEPVQQSLIVKPGQGDATISLVLAPLPQSVQVNTNFSSGAVMIDGRRMGDLVNGSFSISGLEPREHLIEVTGSGAGFKARWRSRAGAAPALLGPVEAKDLDVTIVSSMGASGRIVSNRDPQSVKIDGSAAGSTGVAGGTRPAPEISLLSEGVRKLQVGDRSTFLEVRRNPTLTVLLALDRNVGTLVVETRPGDARVYLNNHLYGQTTGSGVLRLPVDIGKYSVRVAREGFRPSEIENVELAKGEEKKLTFTLTGIPAILLITGLTPGEAISIDGRPRGAAGPSQTLRFDDLPAGGHTIEIVRDGYNPGRQNVQMAAGETTNLDAAKVVLVKKESPPPQPDPAAVESRDWDRVRNSSAIDELQTFLNQHATGPHADDARNRISQLRQAQAREVEDKAFRDQESAWTSLDKTRTTALQDFITRYAVSPHVPEARTLLNALEKKAADELAAQRANEQRSRDQEAVRQTLARYQAAFGQMDVSALQSVWTGSPAEVKKIREQLKNFKSYQVKLTLTSPIAVNADSAIAECMRIVTGVPAQSPTPISHQDRVRITLARSGSTWVIREIAPLKNPL